MTLHLEVVTPKGKALDLDIDEVTLPGTLGEFTVLEGHIPVLSALRAGILRYSIKGSSDRLAISGQGYAEVGGHKKVLVITDRCMAQDEIDADMAQEELEDAQAQLSTYAGPTEDAEYRHLQQQLDWAKARLSLLER